MRILKNALSIGAMQVSALLLGVVLMPYITRIFGSALLGINSFGMAVVSYFGIAGSLGIPLYGVREVAKHRDSPEGLQRVVSQGVTYQLFFSLMSTLLYALWVVLQPSNESSYLMLFCITMLATGTDLVWIYGGLERFDRIAIRTVTMRLVGTGLVFLLVHDAEDFSLFITIQQGSIFVSNAFYWFSLRNYGISLRLAPLRNTLRAMLRPCALLFIPIALGAITLMLDRVLLGYLAPRSELAIYDYAARLAKIGVTLVAVLGNVMFPRLSSIYSNGSISEFRSAVERMVGVGLIVGFAVSGMLISVATPLCNLLFGDSFVGSDEILRLVAMPVFSSGMGLYFITVAVGREGKLIRALSISAIVVVIADAILIPLYGAKGAAIGYLLGEISLQASYIYELKDVIAVRRDLGYMAKLLMCVTVAVVASSLLFIESDWFALLAQGICFSLFYSVGIYLISNRVRKYAHEGYKTLLRNK